MNVSTVLALLAAALGAYAGLLAWRYRLAPGLQEQGWFALAAFTAAAFTALNMVTTAPAPATGTVVWAAKLQLLLGAVHVVAWFRYSSAFMGRPWPRERLLTLAQLALAAPLLLPGVGFTGEVTQRPVGALDVVYNDATPSAYGVLVIAVMVASFLAMTARFAAAWRRGVPWAGVHVAALGLLFVMALNDLLTLAGVLRGLYLLDLGFLAPVAAVTYGLSGRVVEESRALAALRARLERAVEERTAELARSRDALHRAERLAALGQFSAGVSHEVSNPAAVVGANLRYLEESLRTGPPPPDAQECLAEARQAIDRIVRLTRQLSDASRFAASPQAPAARLGLAAAAAAAAARARRDGLDIAVAVPADLWALGEPQGLAEVLDRLLDNAVRALRPGGRVRLTAERAAGRARLVVEDDGLGMDERTLDRAFDPFFSTRPFGSGTGLGLPVARGLVHAMRGELRLESAPGRGTRAVVELPLADPPATPP